MGSTATLRNLRNSIQPQAGWANLNGRVIAVVGLLALLAFVVVPVATNWLGDLDVLMFAAVSLALLLTILVGTIRVSKRELDVLTWRTGLIMWAFLLGSQQFFLRSFTPADEALNYAYDAAAYAEAATWLAAGLVIFVIAIRSPEQLRRAWSGNFKLIVLFAVMCGLSASYSPTRLLAFAWCFKLVLVVLVLNMCSREMHTATDIRSFLLATFWGFVMLMVMPVIKGIATGEKPFLPDGRLSYFDHPVHGALWAGVVLLLALIVFAERPRSALPWAGIAAAIMLVSGGKTGIVAGVLSALLLFALRGKPGQALLMLVGVAALGVPVLVYTPVSQYLETYWESGAATTLTGRTDLWDASVPMILERPLFGHGYMSARFMSLSDRLESFNWHPAEAHNSFLEIAYTNGAVGLILLLTLHCAIVRCLWAAFKQHRLLAAAGLALYANLLLQSAVENTVSGKPSDSFMLLLALVVVSEKLVNLTPSPSTAQRSFQS